MRDLRRSMREHYEMRARAIAVGVCLFVLFVYFRWFA